MRVAELNVQLMTITLSSVGIARKHNCIHML